MRKGKNFIIPLVVYPFDAMISIAETDEVLFSKLRKHLPEDCHGDIPQYAAIAPSGQGRYVMFPNNASLIRLKHYPTSPEVKGYLAHEIFHCVEFLFEKIRVEHNINSSETWAYLIGYLTTEIYKKL
jgi:hypothetical protein